MQKLIAFALTSFINLTALSVAQADAVVDSLLHRPLSAVFVSRTTTAPTLDGRLDDAAWQAASRLSAFVQTAGKPGQPARLTTDCRLLFDDTHLYIAFRCQEPDGAGMRQTTTTHDDPDIQFDDRVEVFLDLAHDHRNFINLCVNPRGVQFDQAGFQRYRHTRTIEQDPTCNVRWQARTRQEAGTWTVEMAIDLPSMGIGKLKPGTTFGFNACRVRHPDYRKGEPMRFRKPGAGAEYSAWVATDDGVWETPTNFYAPADFGDLIIGPERLRLTDVAFPTLVHTWNSGPFYTPSHVGWNPLLLRVKAQSPLSAVLTVSVSSPLPPASGQEAGPDTLRWQRQFPMWLPTDTLLSVPYFVGYDGENRITLRWDDTASRTPLYQTSYIETVPQPVSFHLEPLYRRATVTRPITAQLDIDEQTRHDSYADFTMVEAASGQVLFRQRVAHLDSPALMLFAPDSLNQLPGGNYHIDYALYSRAQQKLLGRYSQPFTRTDPALPVQFGVKQASYCYGGVAAPALRVQFPFAAEFVFWRGASFVPWWEMEGAVMSNEFVEAWDGGMEGCAEPMQDRDCRYSSVSVLEQSAARAVVRWRYALNDAHYRIYYNEWVEETYTFYPDGVGTRQVTLAANVPTEHELMEIIFVKPPSMATADLFDEPVATVTNLAGQQCTHRELAADPALYKAFLSAPNEGFVFTAHFRDRYQPFSSWAFRPDILPQVSRKLVSVGAKPFSQNDHRGHWPTSLYAIDGYNTPGLERANHTDLGNIHAQLDTVGTYTWTFLIGTAPAGSTAPLEHTRSWLRPLQLVALSQAVIVRGYVPAERAYRLVAGADSGPWRVKATGEGEVKNPVFMLNQAAAPVRNVWIDKQKLNSGEYQSGLGRRGEQVIWLNHKLRPGQVVQFTF